MRRRKVQRATWSPQTISLPSEPPFLKQELSNAFSAEVSGAVIFEIEETSSAAGRSSYQRHVRRVKTKHLVYKQLQTSLDENCPYNCSRAPLRFNKKMTHR